MTKNLHFLPFASLPEIKRGKGIVNHLIASNEPGELAAILLEMT